MAKFTDKDIRKVLHVSTLWKLHGKQTIIEKTKDGLWSVREALPMAPVRKNISSILGTAKGTRL